MNVVFLGATKGMGRSLARLMAERGDTLFLLGRDEEELSKSAADLGIRGTGGNVSHAPCDLEKPAGFEAALDRAGDALGQIHCVVVSAGIYASQEMLENDAEELKTLLTVNFTNTILFCEAARCRLLFQGGGKLCVFSSVAGDRGRKPIGLYGATKSGLSQYLESLDHRYRKDGLYTICVKPGFVRTGMTAGLKPPPFAGEPDGVAKVVLKAIDWNRPVVYAPPIWRWIMFVIKRLPRTIMRRVGF